MFRVQLIAVGKLKEGYLREAFGEYEKRLKPFCAFTLTELPESRLPSKPTPGQIAAALREEGAAIAARCRGAVVPLCVEGKTRTSPEFADLLSSAMRAPGELTFVIGSSYGLAEEVKRLGERLSFSPMTFPHQLMRVLLMEQLYRGFEILSGAPYHK